MLMLQYELPKKVWWKLKRFANTNRFSDHDTMKVILLLWKGAYPYEHIDDIEKSDPTSPPETKGFYCHLNMEDTTDADYTQTQKKVVKNF